MASDQKFPIVGIGASAGGLEALEDLFRDMPTDIGMAFVLVTHMARRHESALPEILGRFTSMPVLLATDNRAINPGHIYVGPPDAILTIEDGRLKLQPRASEQQQKPIDVFLSSLAEDRGESAVGIVLSGGGSDGALGIKAIKERGGFTLAQGSDGHGPQQSGMPDTAIASGVVDLVLPAERMADYLAHYARTIGTLEEAVKEKEGGHQAIYNILLNRVGHDFSGYKEKTFARRVRRRMQVLQLTNLDKYIERLRGDPDQVTLLFRDLLIGVTNFFRDPEAFKLLADTVIPKLFEGKGVADTVRIWIPGCSTGEEVYSIAILVREHLDTLNITPKIQLFATDIDEPALAVARGARYPRPLLDNVSPERLKRFFSSDDVSHAVNKEIREMCIFSSHSVLRDPPFSKIDLISCRNLLIYLGTDFQSQVIPVFHFALRPRGYLFLGTSENVSQHGDLFQPVDKRQRIFQRREHSVSRVQFPLIQHRRTIPSEADLRREPSGIANLRRVVDAYVLERVSPAHVVVNRDGDILHYSARTGKYLEPAAGLPNRQLIAMARRDLRLDLQSALREAIATGRSATREGIRIEIEDRAQNINVTVEPLGEQSDPLFLVIFRDVGRPVPASELNAPSREGNADEARDRLESELRDTRERLQASVEEYETAVEELKSSNEELQSINEELQSTNEELESSKEELQSVNEELQTVNAELNAKVEEADRATSDLQNVFESTRIALVFLDRDLVIRSFTPAIGAIFKLISTDRGRPLTDIASNIDLEQGELHREIRSVIERGDPAEHNIRTIDGAATYLMRILPYGRRNGPVEGVLVTFVDVTKIVEAEAQQRTLVEELNHRVRNMLTIVNAIATETKRQSPSMDAFTTTFTGRMRAMGATYGTVSRQNWGAVALNDIIESQLQPFKSDGGRRVVYDGPAVWLPPSAALSLGLVVHELATNAIKHGALSSPGGSVTIAWTLDRASHVLDMTWKEEGGPPPKTPERKGFGTTLIDRELRDTLGATARFDYGTEGLVGRFSIPLKSTGAPLQAEVDV